jgi:NADH dehydrogenase [ubiquinone] 1 alpha subcomplex assembly factor 5
MQMIIFQRLLLDRLKFHSCNLAHKIKMQLIRRSSSTRLLTTQRRQILPSIQQQKRCIYEAPQPKMKIFDKQVHLMHKENSLKYGMEYEYIREEMAESLLDRLQIVARNFTNVAEIGCGKNHFLPRLVNHQIQASTKANVVDLGVKRYVLCDNSNKMLEAAQTQYSGNQIEIEKRLVNEEEPFPLEPSSFDLIVASGYLHWINDLPGAFAEIRKALKPDGLFMGAILGGDTLEELRMSFVLAEQEREGGVSPHVSPLVSVRDAGNLLTRAGFAIPTIDNDYFTVHYPDAFTLMNHLQYNGENNALLSRRFQISKETIAGAAAIYDNLFKTEQGVSATFEIIYLVAWAPDPSQPKAARRGSGQIHMSDLAKDLGAEFHVAKDDDPDAENEEKSV